MSDTHAQRELDVFQSFAAARGWGDAATAQKRYPPEPDLLVRVADQPPIALELVEIKGEDWGGLIGLLISTKNALGNFYENLDHEQRTRFAENYGNAILFFRFTQYSTLNQRKQKLRTAFAKLFALPAGFSGEALVEDSELLPTLSAVSISRGRFHGPVFDSESMRSLGDPTPFAIAKKFAKKYKTNFPVELLAYIEGQPMFPEDVWRGNLKEFLSAQVKPFPFAKIWLLDTRRAMIVGEYTADNF